MTSSRVALEELRQASDDLAGAISGTTSDKLIHFFKELLPRVKVSLSAIEPVDKLPAYHALPREQRAFLDKVNQHSFAELREYRAYCPAGLHAPYADYLKALVTALDHSLGFLPNTLNPYLIFLAQLTSSRNAAFSSEDHAAQNKALAAKRTHMDTILGSFFKPGSMATETKLSVVLERNADWVSVFHQASALGDKVIGLKLTSIQQQVRQAEDYLDIVHNLAVTGKLESATPEVMSNLAQGAYQVASELEFLSVTYYRILTATEAIKKTVDSLTYALR